MGRPALQEFCGHVDDGDRMQQAGVVVGTVELSGRPVAESVDELLAGARRLGTFSSSDARSPAPFEHVEVDGERCVVKFVHVDHDFGMRTAGDVGCLPRRVWEVGLMDVAPDLIDHATLGAARWGRNGWGVALLMRDVSDALIPAGDEPVAEAVHAALVDHLAGLSARCWGWRDDLDLLPVGRRWEFFSAADDRRRARPSVSPRPSRGSPTTDGARSPSERRTMSSPSSMSCAPIRAVSSPRWRRRPARSSTATGSSATSATRRTAARCCSTGRGSVRVTHATS